MKTPVVFTFNLRRSVYDMFGTSHFDQIRRKYQGVYLLPIVNNLDEGIEQRAQKIKAKLPSLLHNINAQQAHIISYSVSGLDTRYALSALQMNGHVRSLTTISSPHLGSRTANLSERNFLRKLQIDPIARLIGIGLKPFHEIVPENIKYFNK